MVLGIDLGTTNSVATAIVDGEIKSIVFDNSELLPSVVHISPRGVIVGVKAKNIAKVEPENTAISIKRKMGQDIKVNLNNKKYSPQEVSSFILKRIKDEAQKELNSEIKEVVITTPAYFNEQQREATKQAGEMAGFTVLRILNEPTAAALSFGTNKDEDSIYAVYDLGGGTFDISIIESCEGVVEVLATSGNSQLGGDDFDTKLAELIWERSGFKIEKTLKIDVKLNQLAEEVKVKLSSEDIVEIDEKFFAKVDNKPLHLRVEVTKEDFNKLIKANILETIELLNSTMEEAEIEYEELSGILLTGGSSRIPLIEELILENTEVLPILIEDPDKSVSIGATIQGALIKGENTDSILVDITPYSLGISTLDDKSFFNEDMEIELKFSKIILKNSPVPVFKTKKFYASTEYQKAYQIDVYQGEHSNLNENIKIGEAFLEINKPVQDGEIDVTFALDVNGILKVEAIEVNTKEDIKVELKSKIGKKVTKKVLSDKLVNSNEENLILKIDAIFNNPEISSDDKNELIELKNRYLNINDEKEKLSIEEEILDLIFYLEE